MINYNIIIVVIGLILMELIAISAILYNIKKKREANITVASIADVTERLKLYAEFDFDKIDSRIDKYISDAGIKYKLANFEYKPREELYLTEDLMNEMIKTMLKEVRMKITPAVFDLIRLSYNIVNEAELISFLYEKIKLYVLNYSIEINTEIEE